jgi:hypothetical protein
MRRRFLAPAIAAASLAFAAGCGSDRLPPRLTPGQRADLHTLVGQARTAAGGGDLAATNAALAQLKARVRTLRDSGALDRQRAAELLKYAVLAELKAAHTVKAPAPATAATPAPTPTPPPAPAPAVTPPAPVPSAPAGVGGGAKAKKPKGHGHGKRAGKGG